MYLKKVAPFLAVVITASLLGGCSTTTPSTVVPTETTLQVQQQEQVYIVKVQTIDEHTITALQGTLTQSGPPALPSGEAPTEGTPPALPSGEVSTEGTPPTLPSGDTSTKESQMVPPGNMGGSTFSESGESLSFTVDDGTAITIEMLQGSEEGTLKQIGVNDILEVTLSTDGIATKIVVKNLQAGGAFGGSQEVTQGTSAHTLESDTTISGDTFASTGDDENALRIDGATVTLEGISVEKLKGNSSNTEDGDFYGQNAALLATNGAQVEIKDATVNTGVTNGNGVFSYGEGTVVTIANSQIHTSASNSGGIQTTGGATMNASNLEVETQGDSSAAIRSDRGGGTVKVAGGSYITNGIGSPAIYSTAAISVSDATLEATQSEALVIEGKNTIALENCKVTGNMNNSHLDSNESVHNIMIYQSMSGDATIGHSTFTAIGGSITAQAGDMIYITNTTCTVELNNVVLALATDTLLNVTGNASSRGWGTQGSNGGTCQFIATNQLMEGKMRVDEISSLDLALQQDTTFTGSVNEENMSGTINVTVDTSSKWILTGNSYITSFDGDLNQIETNGYQLFVGGEQVK